MKVKIEDKKNCQKVLKIEVESQKVSAVFDAIFKEIGADAQIAGFRKGKAPQDIVRAHYSDAAKDEALRRLVWDAYAEAIKGNSLEPVGYPVIEDVNLSVNGPLSFTVKVDTKPEINLKPYTKIKIKKISADVTEEDLKKALEAIRLQAASFKIVEGRPVKAGDYIVSDYVYSRKDKPDEVKKNAWMYIDEKSDSFPVPKALIGCNKGETKEGSDKDGTYKITVKEIKEKVLPEINDEMAKQVGNFENLEKLKDALRLELVEDKKRSQQMDMESQVFTHLLDVNQFEVPESVVQRQLDNLVNDTKMRLAYQGYKKEEIDAQQDKLKEGMAVNAQKQVKIFFMLDAIAKKENITVTQDEIDERVEKIAMSNNQDLEKFRQTLEKQGLMDNVYDQLLHDKVIEFLKNNASIAGN